MGEKSAKEKKERQEKKKKEAKEKKEKKEKEKKEKEEKEKKDKEEKEKKEKEDKKKDEEKDEKKDAKKAARRAHHRVWSFIGGPLLYNHVRRLDVNTEAKSKESKVRAKKVTKLFHKYSVKIPSQRTTSRN